MCGRYTLYSPEDIGARYMLDYELNTKDFSPNYNVGPTKDMPVIINSDGKGNQLAMMHWGLVPSWAKDPTIGFKMINARAESVALKPSFKASFKRRRCLIPANGFYEWKKEKGKSLPFYFSVKEMPLFSFAGLYDYWQDPNGSELDSYTIITTTPNDLVKTVHDRMPVILSKKDEAKWLDLYTSENELVDMLKPFDTQSMTGYEVSPQVNGFAVNNPSLINPIPGNNHS